MCKSGSDICMTASDNSTFENCVWKNFGKPEAEKCRVVSYVSCSAWQLSSRNWFVLCVLCATCTTAS